MGCSSSTQTQTQDSNRPAAKPSDTNGLQKCGEHGPAKRGSSLSDENSPITEENETIPDQTKLDSMEEVDLTPEETKPSENLPAKETEVLIPATAECVNSDYKREDLEGIQPLAAEPLDGTEPQVKQIEMLPPAGSAEGTGIPPPAGSAEGTGIPPPAGSAEGTGIPPPAGSAEGTGIPPPAGSAEGTGIPPPAGSAEGTGIPPPAGSAEGTGTPPPARPAESTGIPPPAGPAESTGIPPPAGPAEGTGIPPPAGPAESTGIPPPAGPAESTGIPPPAGPAEGSVHPVTEVIWKVKSNKEDQLIEGETGEKVETEKHSELVSEGTETKEEETGEAVDATAAPEIACSAVSVYTGLNMWSTGGIL
ncbi:glutamate-rich protein 5 isoform X2 [Pelodiscus sinensis]|uniref:glutamate-rich protein 5 isoform X2 n=1 Tax=Pelodiscus sinensis TaxID=13735 RepID=UPI003F6AC285